MITVSNKPVHEWVGGDFRAMRSFFKPLEILEVYNDRISNRLKQTHYEFKVGHFKFEVKVSYMYNKKGECIEAFIYGLKVSLACIVIYDTDRDYYNRPVFTMLDELYMM